jgi:hypothetical protein
MKRAHPAALSASEEDSEEQNDSSLGSGSEFEDFEVESDDAANVPASSFAAGSKKSTDAKYMAPSVPEAALLRQAAGFQENSRAGEMDRMTMTALTVGQLLSVCGGAAWHSVFAHAVIDCCCLPPRRLKVFIVMCEWICHHRR